MFFTSARELAGDFVVASCSLRHKIILVAMTDLYLNISEVT